MPPALRLLHIMLTKNIGSHHLLVSATGAASPSKPAAAAENCIKCGKHAPSKEHAV
jgi:hypothetical protein